LTSQKQKFLASAQKYIQKGQFERALKDYEQVVTADPKDVKHRQKLAELLVRCNRREDAIREYETIARYYDDNGFNLKAIAVYKQIQRLNPSNIEISLSLAALNEKQGMIGNALSEYRTVFLHYEKAGRAEDALHILEKMRGVDPDNADIMRKLAETLYASGAKDKSYQEFTRLAIFLKNRGMSEYYEKICSIIARLFPEKTDSSLDILSEQIRNGVVGDAIPRLNQLLCDDPDNPKILALLAEAYRISGDAGNRKEILKRLILHTPGDLSLIKGLIECSVEEKDVEGSLSLIEEYQSALYESGALGEIEHYYTTLQNFVPYDTRILEALKRLYETTGESSKLADVAVSLNILKQKAGGNNVPQQGQNGQSYSSSTDPSAPEDLPWGDEIDLSNTADIISDHSGNAIENTLEDFAAVDLSSEPPETGVTDIDEFEIDISFDLPEDTHTLSHPTEEGEYGESFLTEKEYDGTDSHVLPETADEGNTDKFEELTEDTVLPSVDIEAPFDFSDSIEDNVSLVTLDEPADFPVDSEVELPSFMEEMDASHEPDSPLPESALSLEAFREHLETRIEKEDAETHYNLGIAYMEMGLHDDAIKQFRIAANDPERELDCLTLHAVCSREKNDYEDSERILTMLLSLKGLQPERAQNLRYELGILYMVSGRKDEALQSFREIFVVNPGFRDTMNLISSLTGNTGSLDLSDVDDMEITLEEIE